MKCDHQSTARFEFAPNLGQSANLMQPHADLSQQHCINSARERDPQVAQNDNIATSAMQSDVDLREKQAETTLKCWLTKLHSICSEVSSSSASPTLHDAVLTLRVLCARRLPVEEVIRNMSEYLHEQNPSMSSDLLQQLTSLSASILATSLQHTDEAQYSITPSSPLLPTKPRCSSDVSRNVHFLETFRRQCPDRFPKFLNLLGEYERGLIDAINITKEVDILLSADRELFHQFLESIDMTDRQLEAITGKSVKRQQQILPHLTSDASMTNVGIQGEGSFSAINHSQEHQNFSPADSKGQPNELTTTTTSTRTTSETHTADSSSYHNMIEDQHSHHSENDDVTLAGKRHLSPEKQDDQENVSMENKSDSSHHIGVDLSQSLVERLWFQSPILSSDVDGVKLFQRIAVEMGDKTNLPAQLKRFLLSREPLRRRSSQFIVPLSELDFTGCPREGRSYLKLPETFRRLWCEGREYESQEILDQLNDDFVSIPQGSEEDAFRHVKRNPYEEMMFNLEDEMFELDVMIGGLEAVVTKLEPLEEDVLKMSLQQRYEYRLPHRLFFARHLKALATVYGDRGAEVLELLRRSPGIAIGSILNRLREKVSEWKEARCRLIEGPWKDIAVKNYYKQFEQKSHYLKALDRFTLIPSALTNQAIVQHAILRDKPVSPEVLRKSKHILRQICHSCGGFPGCPTIPKNIPQANIENKTGNTGDETAASLQLSLTSTLDANCLTDGPPPKTGNNHSLKSIEITISSLNVHLDYPFGCSDEHSFCHHDQPCFDYPEFEYTGMNDSQIHRHLLQLFACASRHSFGDLLSASQSLALQRLRRFLLSIVRGIFKISTDTSVEHLEVLGTAASVRPPLSDDYVHTHHMSEESETSPDIKLHAPDPSTVVVMSDGTSASDFEHSSAKGSSKPSPIDISAKENIKGIEGDVRWRRILTSRQITSCSAMDGLSEWKAILKQFLDSDIGFKLDQTDHSSPSLVMRNSDDGDKDPPASHDNSVVTLFANGGLYCIVRFYCQLYERLARLKLLINQRKDPSHPSSAISWSSDDPGVEKRLPYESFFNSVILHLGSTELTQEMYEDNLRVAGGNEAVFLNTLPSILSTISRLLSSIINDIDVQRLSALFLSYSQGPAKTLQHSAVQEYHSIARCILGSQATVYQITFDPAIGCCSIRVFTGADCDQLKSLHRKDKFSGFFQCAECQQKPNFEFRAVEKHFIYSIPLCHSYQCNLLQVALGPHILRVQDDQNAQGSAVSESIEAIIQPVPNKSVFGVDTESPHVSSSDGLPDPNFSGSRKRPRNLQSENEQDLDNTRTPQQSRRKSRRLLRQTDTIENESIRAVGKELRTNGSEDLEGIGKSTSAVPMTIVTRSRRTSRKDRN